MLTQPQDAAPQDAPSTAGSPAALTPSASPVTLKEHPAAGEKPCITDDILIEEVSIDGMCGVY